MQDLSLYFRALGDRKRLHVVEFLAAHHEVTVTRLGEELRLSQPLISWHLRILRRAGIIKTRKSGRMVFCSLNGPAIERYQHRVNALFALEKSTQDRDTEASPGDAGAEIERRSRVG